MMRISGCYTLFCFIPLVACAAIDEPSTPAPPGASETAPQSAGAASSVTSTAMAPHVLPTAVAPAMRRTLNTAWGQPAVPAGSPKISASDRHWLQFGERNVASGLALPAPPFVLGPQHVLLDTSQFPSLMKDLTNAAGATAATIAKAVPGIGLAVTIMQVIIDLLNSSGSTQNQFAALSNQLNQVAANLTWVTTEEAREKVYGDMVGDLSTVQDALNLDQVPILSTSFAAGNAQNNVADAEQPIHYQRAFLESATDGAKDGIGWKSIIRDRAPVSNGLVYDWRLGLPWLMKLVSMRMPVLGAEDPNFAVDGTFSAEFIEYAQTLYVHRQQMIDAIRCSATSMSILDGYGVDTGNVEYDVGCADINTGAHEIFSVFTSPTMGWPFDTTPCNGTDISPPDQTCLDQAAADLQTWVQQNVISLEGPAYNDVLAGMPIAEIDNMLTVLWNLVPGQ